MKKPIAALIAASILITPVLAFAEHGADDMIPHVSGSVQMRATTSTSTIKARVEDRMDRREDRRDDRQEVRQEDRREDRREDRQEDRLERHNSTSTASSTKSFKRPMPKFLSWIFGQSDDTTIGDIKAQIVASSTASSTPVRAHFFNRLRSLFHF